MKLSDNIIQLRHYTESKGQTPLSASFRKVNEGWVSNIPLFKRRIFSFIVDLAVVSCFNIAVFQGFALGIDELFTPVSYNVRLNLLTGISSEVYFGVFISLYMAYFLFTGFVWDGKSFGKRLFKLSIVTN